MITITRLAKSGGPLTKRISLVNGKPLSDGSACVMSAGEACRARLDDLDQFAALIDSLGSHEAIALGAPRSDLPDRLKVTTKRSLAGLNGAAVPHLIARTQEFIQYRPNEPAMALIDIDVKGMPASVGEKV